MTDLTFIQSFRQDMGWADMIVPVHTGDAVPFQRPVIYYRDNGPFRLYAVFHRRDYSELPWPIKSLDEHEFDLEGVLVGPNWSASVFHNEIKYHEGPCHEVFIEHGGHGIEFVQKWQGAWIYYPPGSYDLVDMKKPKVWAMFEGLRETFNNQGVHLPDQWCEGLMWDNPDKVKLACQR